MARIVQKRCIWRCPHPLYYATPSSKSSQRTTAFTATSDFLTFQIMIRPLCCRRHSEGKSGIFKGFLSPLYSFHITTSHPSFRTTQAPTFTLKNSPFLAPFPKLIATLTRCLTAMSVSLKHYSAVVSAADSKIFLSSIRTQDLPHLHVVQDNISWTMDSLSSRLLLVRRLNFLYYVRKPVLSRSNFASRYCSAATAASSAAAAGPAPAPPAARPWSTIQSNPWHAWIIEINL